MPWDTAGACHLDVSTLKGIRWGGRGVSQAASFGNAAQLMPSFTWDSLHCAIK